MLGPGQPIKKCEHTKDTKSDANLSFDEIISKRKKKSNRVSFMILYWRCFDNLHYHSLFLEVNYMA